MQDHAHTLDVSVNHTAVVPRFLARPYDKWTIRDVDFAPVSSDELGHVLRPVARPELCQNFSHEEIEALQKEGQLKVSHDFFLPAKAQARNTGAEFKLTDLPPKKLRKVLFRKHMCDGILRLEAEKATSRSDAALEKAIEGPYGEFIAHETARQTTDGRCGTDTLVPNRPSPTTMRKWLRRYEACGYTTASLCDSYGRSGNRTPRFGGEERALLDEFADKYASRLKPTKAQLYFNLKAKIEQVNSERASTGLRQLACPSRGALERAIAELDPFHVFAGREGEEAARKKFFIVRSGPDVTRPLERVELDEWNISLQTMLEKADVWSRLSADQKAAVQRKRLWLSTALDTLTRCILAARIIETPSGSAAVATLEMAVNDKSAYAEAAGCETAWDMIGTPEGIVTDSGSSYISYEFRAAATDLESEVMFPPAGLPQMRGRQERFFRTLHKQLIARFDGRTFENVVAKGDYDSEAHAIVDVEELSRIIVRYIVDVYHNTPHSGLGGETPRNAWLRLTKQHPIIPPPDPDLNRHIFGTTVERRITNEGIRFLGLQYQSLELQRLRREVGQKPILVRIDPLDISHISVREAKGWRTVACEQSGFDGVSISQWLAAERTLRRSNANMAALSQAVVHRAVLDIQEFAEKATERACIGSPILAAADFERFEQERFRTFGFARGTEDGPPVLDEPEANDESTSAVPFDIPTDALEPAPHASASGDDEDDSDWFMED
jgi:putative transposase